MLKEHKRHLTVIEAIRHKGNPHLYDDIDYNYTSYLALKEKLKRYEASLILKEREKEQERKDKLQIIKERDIYHKLVD